MEAPKIREKMTKAEQTALQEKVAQLPLKPGVYQFFDANKKLLYIGKATKLRSRVQSYFRYSTQLSGAKQFMVHQITDLKTIVVDTEPEALLLETTLIKKHQPPYNVVMKDDKNFQYIHITEELYPRIETLRQLYSRDNAGRYVRKPGFYFGPYISGYAVKRTLRLLKSIFHFCEHAPVVKRGKVVFPQRACLDFHLGRCVGPCDNAISPEEYQKIFVQIRRFLEGDYEPIQRYLHIEMKHAAADQAYERAARLRDQLAAIDSLMAEQKVVSPTRENADYLTLARVDSTAAVNLFMVRKGSMVHQNVFVLKNTKDQSDEEVLQAFHDQYYAQTVTKPPNVYMSTEKRRGRNRKLLKMGYANAEQALKKQQASFEKHEKQAREGLAELAAALNTTVDALQRIEVYDISNNQGEHTVASMIVFEDGMPASAQYRKFRIRTVQGPDDFASMREVIDRRVRHLPEKVAEMAALKQQREAMDGSEEGLPPQKKAKDPWPRPDLIIIDGGKGQLSSAQSIMDIYSLDIPVISLAKREEEIFRPGEQASIRLPKDSQGMYLIQRMRDEAHRFAIGFYRRQHLKDLV